MKSNLTRKNPIGEVVQRPWGSYKVLETKGNQLVKQIDVFPGEMLSLQSHFHRNEHWTVVWGVAHVQKGSFHFCLREGETTIIPMKTKHRLTNQTDLPLRIIEIQYGDLLDEEDIVRYDDLYGRC